jgi:hypothetical protein
MASKHSSPIATKLSSSRDSMAGREVTPYGADLSKKPDMLACTTIPLEVTPIFSNQSYYAQAIRRLLIAPPLLCLEGKPLQQEPKLDAQKLFKVTKEINYLPPKDHEVLTRLKTNKFGDVTCAKYHSVTPRTIIDGVRAMPKQIMVVLPRKRKAPSPPKRPRMTIALLEKKLEDLSDVVYTLEQRLDEERVRRKSLKEDLNALNHFVVKSRKEN